MKNSAKRFLPLIPMIIWVLLWVGIAAGASFGYSSTHHDLKPGENKLWLIALVDIIALFDIAWYLMSATRNNETGIVNKVGNWIILDFPAVMMINHWFRIKKTVNAKLNEKQGAYVKKVDVPVDAKEEEEWDVDLADWEKEILKKKNKNKYEKYVAKEHTETIVDYKIQEERKVIRGFSVYTMYQIYRKDPEIVNTYRIIQLYNALIEDDETRNNYIKSFVKTNDLITFIEDYDPKSMTEKMMSDLLTNTVPAEFEVAFKQDRVQIMIDAKDNWYDRDKTKSISSKKTTKKSPAKKTTKKPTTKKSNKKSTK